MLNIPEYKEYGGETKIALMDNSSLAFMHELSQKSYPSDGILSVYDLILIPKWVMEEIEDSTYRSTYVEQLQAQGYAHEFQTNAERILTGKTEFTPALDSPISVAFKSNDFILCQMYREGALTLEAVRQLRHDDRKLTYTRQQADKSIICRKEVITKEQFIDLIQDATVQILF